MKLGLQHKYNENEHIYGKISLIMLLLPVLEVKNFVPGFTMSVLKNEHIGFLIQKEDSNS